MADDRKQTPVSGDQKPAQPGSHAGEDDGRDKTLTEKTEEQAGGDNKKTPGPIYDV